MRSILIGTIILSIAAAYYFYLPLPSTISEPWKLMLMDAVIRGSMHLVRFYIEIRIYVNAITLAYIYSCNEVTGFMEFTKEFC